MPTGEHAFQVKSEDAGPDIRNTRFFSLVICCPPLD